MMARAPTRFSRVSFGWVSSTKSIVDADAGDTGDAYSFMGTGTFDGDVTMNDDLSVTGDATVTGDAAITGDTTIGGAGSAIGDVFVSTISVGGAAVAGNDSTTSQYLFNIAAANDVVLALSPDESKWSGAYHDLNYGAVVSTNSTINFTFTNSAETDVTPDAMNWRVTIARFA